MTLNPEYSFPRYGITGTTHENRQGMNYLVMLKGVIQGTKLHTSLLRASSWGYGAIWARLGRRV